MRSIDSLIPSRTRRSMFAVLAAPLTSCVIVAASLAAPRAASTAGQLATPTAALIRLKSGLTLDYVVAGAARGRPIVLLHGAGDSWHSWDRVLPLLPARYRVYAITLRGHGRSDHPSRGYARADFAADIADFLDQRDLRDVVLVGHSLGSLVAQAVAEADRDRVSRLVLVGSGPGGIRDAQARDEIRKTFSALQDPIAYTFARDFQAGTIHHPIPAAFFETMVGEAMKVPADTWRGLGEFLSEPHPVQELSRIHAGTLVCWGDRDSIFGRADQDALVSAIPGARLQVFRDTGHALHWERPAEFVRALLGFLS